MPFATTSRFSARYQDPSKKRQDCGPLTSQWLSSSGLDPETAEIFYVTEIAFGIEQGRGAQHTHCARIHESPPGLHGAIQNRPQTSDSLPCEESRNEIA